jgi:hypothetical protein
VRHWQRRQLRVLRRLRTDAHGDADRDAVTDADRNLVDGRQRLGDTRDALAFADADAVRRRSLA